MKIIGQYEIDEIEKVFNGIYNLENYKVDGEIYSYFLFEIYEKDFWKFVKNIDFKLASEYYALNPDEDILKKIHLTSKAKEKYAKKFHTLRDKFYLVNDTFYSYNYLGDMNVGHVIEITEYESEDIVIILNHLINENNKQRNKNLLLRILNK